MICDFIQQQPAAGTYFPVLCGHYKKILKRSFETLIGIDFKF
jgi:hypothetical protein